MPKENKIEVCGPEVEKVRVCPICGNWFRRAGEAYIHQKAQHREQFERPGTFLCMHGTCTRQFESAKERDEHAANIHK